MERPSPADHSAPTSVAPTPPTPEQTWRYRVSAFSAKASRSMVEIGTGNSASPAIRRNSDAFIELAESHRRLAERLRESLIREGVDVAALDSDPALDSSDFSDTEDSPSFRPHRSVLRLRSEIEQYHRPQNAQSPRGGQSPGQ